MMRGMLATALGAIGLQNLAPALKPKHIATMPVKVVGGPGLRGRSTGSNQRKRRKRERQLRGGK